MQVVLHSFNLIQICPSEILVYPEENKLRIEGREKGLNEDNASNEINF